MWKIPIFNLEKKVKYIPGFFSSSSSDESSSEEDSSFLAAGLASTFLATGFASSSSSEESSSELSSLAFPLATGATSIKINIKFNLSLQKAFQFQIKSS